MPRDGQSALLPLKPTAAYPHPAHPIKEAPRKVHKKGLKLTRNRSRLRMQVLCMSIAMPGPTRLTNLNVLTLNASGMCFPFHRVPYTKVISFEMNRDRMIGPGALMIRLMSVVVGIISHAIEQLRD